MSQAAPAPVVCDICARTYRWKPELANKKGKCKCGGTVIFPGTDPAAGGMVMAETPALGAVKGGGEYDMETAAPAPARAVRPMPKMAACKGCTAMIPSDAVICTRCGMNQKTGKKMGTQIAATPAVVVQPTPGIGVTGRLILSMVIGGVAAVIGAILWIALIILTSRQWGIAAWALGLGIGALMRLMNPGGGKVGGWAAAGFAFLSLAIAKLVIVVLLLGAHQDVSHAFSGFDALWLLLAMSSAYRLASRV